MNIKRLSEFGLSLALSLSSLLVIAVPKAHAATESVYTSQDFGINLVVIIVGVLFFASKTRMIAKIYSHVSLHQ